MRLSDLSPDFVVQETFFTVTFPGTVQILNPEPTRFAVLFAQPPTGSTVFMSTMGTPQVNQGWSTTAQVPYLQMTYRDFGPMVCGPWFATSNSGTQKLTAFEVFYRPRIAGVGMGEISDQLAEIGGVQ